MNSAQAYGRVYLVGAGPGDEGLMTVRGMELLGQADVVLFDGLANRQLLRNARPDAKLVCVGKHGHGGVWTQSEIDAATVDFAKQGLTVVRLKGGDTAIFARTSEEIDRLQAEGIPFEVVPGITAALAVSAYTGIPLTHRDWASAVALVTGQLQPNDGSIDAEDDLDWKSLASFQGTLVLYMGFTTAKSWSHKLMQFGMPPTTPVALARRISWPDQQVVRCNLETVAETIDRMSTFRPPVIAVIGEVVKMSATGDWFSSRPLHGTHFVVASPDSTGKKLQQLLAQQGACVIHEPSLTIAPPLSWEETDREIDQLSSYDWIVFSSPNGVESFMTRLHQRGFDARAFGSCRIASVGTTTSASLAHWHLVADRTPQVSGIENLAKLLVPESRNRRFLFVRTPLGKTTGMERLAESGAVVHGLEVYRQLAVDRWPDSLLNAASLGTLNGIVVTSQNVALGAVQLLGEAAESMSWFCLSEAISQSLCDLGFPKVYPSKEPTIESLVSLIKQHHTQSV